MMEATTHGISKTDLQVDTNGGNYIGGNVATGGGDFIGRDLNIYVNQAPVLKPPAPEQPPTIQDFVGREVELAHYAEALQKSGVALITGMPGVGKTTLATMLAQQMTTVDKVFWHAFHENEDASVFVWKLAGFLAFYGQEAV